ncbi:uncharacterized protein PV06_07889 [Exophiala oligosperma]|uniref:Galactosyl transferase GMA12/MNN10 family protein n=2 Tax=Chaetothyriales TaxID=34395 RepID=A0A0D2BTC8_9EURO|nr:uncharacterized protein PV06_07889 [Exophiala oligosperma]KAJ9645408.1 hypothetical protein H2204_000987 [Knufia peltigerae]KIW40712.1 hypothetical protein PV06_07889 [Exophiala oligosperma]
MTTGHNASFRGRHRLGRVVLLATALIMLILYATNSRWEHEQQPHPIEPGVLETPIIDDPATVIAKQANPTKDQVAPHTMAANPEDSPPTEAPRAPTAKSLTEHDKEISPSGEGNLYSKIGKLTMLYYNEVSKDTIWYEKALSGHKEHNMRFGYKHFVLRHEIVPDIWSKQAFILSILLQELAKPMGDRLEWLFWHDADLVLMNSNIPLELFVPPVEFSHIHHVVANDLNGLNAGVFFLRVHEWSMWYLSAVMSYTNYHPERPLRYSEQTAMEWLIQEEKWGRNTTHVPQRWFNAYQNFGIDDTVPPEWEWRHGYFEPGDLLIHLPGTSEARPDIIRGWLSRVRDQNARYEIPLADTTHVKNITEFWNNDARHDKKNQDTYWRRWHILIRVGTEQDDQQREAVAEAERLADKAGLSPEKKEQKVDEVKEKFRIQKIAALRRAEQDKLKEEGLLQEQAPTTER